MAIRRDVEHDPDKFMSVDIEFFTSVQAGNKEKYDLIGITNRARVFYGVYSIQKRKWEWELVNQPDFEGFKNEI